MAKSSPNRPTTMSSYHSRIITDLSQLEASQWDALPHTTPFTHYAYLRAMQDSQSAIARTGWQDCFVTLWQSHDAKQGLPSEQLVAACPMYLKSHSYGEYVFDFAWADAYERHGLAYYPKALVAPPFTPVPGARLLAHDGNAKLALLQTVLQWCKAQGLSSLHLLFIDDDDAQVCEALGLMLRHGVQFHWTNQNYADFEGFLTSLTQEKRKKIKQERRKVQDAGVTCMIQRGNQITTADWDFFYRCYSQTYVEHGNAPYLQRAFFGNMQAHMADNWLLIQAFKDGHPIACSLIGLSDDGQTAYGRYWGALERVDCLHFELCYYQPLEWCIGNHVHRFEGGAQGEHKMARALLPTATQSAHWLAHPDFAHAVQDFLKLEEQHIRHYQTHLQTRSPLKNQR